MLEVRGLQVRYGAVLAVDALDLQVDGGEIVVLIGANGAGKSSVLNTIAGLVRPAAGEVLLGGVSITARHPADRVRDGLALVIEGRGVFADMTVRENLELGAYGKRALRGARMRADGIERIVALFPKLGQRMDQVAGSLSGGEQQMLVIGRALMSNPRLLLLDEPSLGLAPRIVEEISQTLRRLASEGGVAILVAEQNAVLGLDLAQRGYVLHNGKLALEGACSKLRDDKDLVRLYLGGGPPPLS